MFKRRNLFCTLLLLIIHLPLFQAKHVDYFRGPSALSYCDSVEYCQRNGGELAVIRNKDQNKAAADICSGNKKQKRLRTTKTNVPCWLGLTEYVGTKNTEIDYQLWIWRDGNASTLPKGRVDKPRMYSLGYMDDMNHTTSKENNQKGVPLSSYEYTNWKKIEPNNNMGCSESHAYMGSDTANLGKWYDTNAHQYVKYLPLCETTNHENPIHDHQCDTTFSNCWYEQCRNTDVGQDDSKCWSKKDSTSPKCSESATPKYTELEMKYDGEVYVEYTCCDDNDDSGREKHVMWECNDNDYHHYDNSIVGALIAMLLLLICVVSALCVCFYCIHHHHNKNYTHNRHINNSNAINVNNSNNQFGAVQMIRVSTPQTVQVTLPANAVPGQSIRVALPSGQHMQVTVPVGATGGSTLTVQYQSPGPSTSSYTNRGAVPPITPQNRDVPQLPQHDWNDKSSGAHVIPQGYGGASKGFTTTPGNGMVTPMVVSIPRVVAQPVQPMQMQMVPQQNV